MGWSNIQMFTFKMWLLQKKSHLQKMIRLPPLWLTVTHWLLSSSTFGFAYVLTGPAAGEMSNIISLRKCCMLCLLPKMNHGFSDISCTESVMNRRKKVLYSFISVNLEVMSIAWCSEVLKTGIYQVIFFNHSHTFPAITKRTSLKKSFQQVTRVQLLMCLWDSIV